MSPIIHNSVRQPFDPSTLRAEVRNATVGTLVDMLKKGLIDLNPEFQRSANLWNDKKKSQLVESILLGLPLPSFYFFVDEVRKKWVVIDGLQRLCSLQSFMVDKTLCLQGLDFLDEGKYGKPFDQFDYFDQLSISMHPVTLNVLTGNTSAAARYIIFQRVNSKGTQLNATEMRNALYQGRATKLIDEMVKDATFQTLVSSHVTTKRMKDKEFASRFLLFFLNGHQDYDGNMDVSIGNTMDFINKCMSDEDARAVLLSFSKALVSCLYLLGEEAFRKPVEKQGKRKNQISLTVFEMLTVSLARLSDDSRSKLEERKESFSMAYTEMYTDNTLQRFLSTGTGKAAATAYRFRKIEEVVRKTLDS